MSCCVFFLQCLVDDTYVGAAVCVTLLVEAEKACHQVTLVHPHTAVSAPEQYHPQVMSEGATSLERLIYRDAVMSSAATDVTSNVSVT